MESAWATERCPGVGIDGSGRCIRHFRELLGYAVVI